MPTSLLILYRTRRLIFTGVAITITAIIWLVLADLIIRYPIGALMLGYTQRWYGYYYMLDHGIRGMMGIYPASLGAHWTVTLIGMGMFFGSQFFFVMPKRGWLDSMLSREQVSRLCCSMIAIPWAVLTVGTFAMVAEPFGLWSLLPFDVIFSGGWKIYPSAFISVPLFFISWAYWYWRARRNERWGDRLMQRAIMLYVLFVTAGVVMFISGLVHMAMHGFISNYWEFGTYSTMGAAASVLFWTLIPGLVLIYNLRSYQDDPSLFSRLLNSGE